MLEENKTKQNEKQQQQQQNSCPFHDQALESASISFTRQSRL